LRILPDCCDLAPGFSQAVEDISQVERSYTGRFLAPILRRREAKRKARMEAAE
jgi:hypothetical protein